MVIEDQRRMMHEYLSQIFKLLVFVSFNKIVVYIILKLS